MFVRIRAHWYSVCVCTTSRCSLLAYMEGLLLWEHVEGKGLGTKCTIEDVKLHRTGSMRGCHPPCRVLLACQTMLRVTLPFLLPTGQVELLMLLSGGSGRITVVGDDAQSIYKWGRRCGGSHLASWSCSSWLVRREQRAWTGGAGLRFSPGGGALTYLARRDGGRLHGMQLLGTGCRSAWA